MSGNFTKRRQLKRDAVQARRQVFIDAREKKEAEEVEKYGKQLARGSIGEKAVELFEGGYVRVLTLRGYVTMVPGPFEKLISIDGSDRSVQKKSAAGRAAGFVVTGGLNMLASNIRGDVILTVVTDKTVHTLSTQVPSNSNLESLHRLLAVGRSILSSHQENGNGTVVASVAEQIEKLAALYQSGALTDEEFQRAKQQALGN